MVCGGGEVWSVVGVGVGVGVGCGCVWCYVIGISNSRWAMLSCLAKGFMRSV